MKCPKHGERPELELSCKDCLQEKADTQLRLVKIARFRCESGVLFIDHNARHLFPDRSSLSLCGQKRIGGRTELSEVHFANMGEWSKKNEFAYGCCHQCLGVLNFELKKVQKSA
jgi:hypothetical protein